jgi:ribosomal protein S18 acetylase RimI-like enzyme
MDPVRLREFRFPEDYPAARFLWEHAGSGIQLRPSDEPEEIRKKLLRDPDLFLVAEDDGKLVGTVMGGFDGRRGMVYHLAVDAEYRTRGIGNRLMEALEERLRLKGCNRCYLLVTRDNDSAMQFYKRRGWKNMDHVYIYGKDLE